MEAVARGRRGTVGRPRNGKPNPVDVHVGSRVRLRRTLLGMSQEKLGEAIGLTFQQVQKYERGSNRISAGTLYRLSQVLDVPVSFFFDCYEVADGGDPAIVTGNSIGSDDSGISRREARLLRLWRSAPEPIANEVLALLSSLAAEGASSKESEPVEEVDGLENSGMAVGMSAEMAQAAANKRNRRRHGAVWDPADIMSAGHD